MRSRPTFRGIRSKSHFMIDLTPDVSYNSMSRARRALITFSIKHSGSKSSQKMCERSEHKIYYLIFIARFARAWLYFTFNRHGSLRSPKNNIQNAHWLCLMYGFFVLAGRRHLFDLFMDFRGPALYSNGREEEDWNGDSSSPCLSFLHPDCNATGQCRSSAKKELDGDRSFLICQQLCLAASPRKSAGGRRGRTPTISKRSHAEIQAIEASRTH